LSKEESNAVITGTTHDVYIYLLRANKPVGIREVQKALRLSSPSVAAYHLNKLVNAEFINHKNGDYVINKVILKNSVKINRLLIPRHFFYAFFAITALIIELSFFRPVNVTPLYFFSTMVTTACALIYCYEMVKTLLGNTP
jgi:hypothetical protein